MVVISFGYGNWQSIVDQCPGRYRAQSVERRHTTTEKADKTTLSRGEVLTSLAMKG
jgi:hypothetical protein